MVEVIVEDTNDKILRLYTRLDSLKRNLPQYSIYSINEEYVREYHSIVQELENTTKLDLAEFKIPEMKISFSTREKFCDKSLFSAKLDALLGYFQIKYLSREKPTIGFKKE